MTTFFAQGTSAPAPEVVNSEVADTEVVKQHTWLLDPPAPTEAVPTQHGRGELKPILASWLKDREEFVGTVKTAGKRAGHTTAWHIVHTHCTPCGSSSTRPAGSGGS